MEESSKWYSKLHWQIAIGLLLGSIAGLIFNGIENSSFVAGFISICDMGGKIFIRLLKMVVVPLVASSLFMGITSIKDSTELGRIGSRTAVYYIFSSLMAILVGLFFVNIIQPGVGSDLASKVDFSQSMDHKKPDSLLDTLVNVVPVNPMGSFSSVPFDMLGLIFFIIIFGIFTMKIEDSKKRPIVEFFSAISDVMMKMVNAIIRLAPIGVFFLVTKLLSQTGADVFIPLLWYLLTVSLALLVHIFGVLPLIAFLVTKKNPYCYMNQMAPALLTAFSTASSAATLALTMKCSQIKGVVSKKVSSLVLPLGATINMDGTALYEGVAVLFIAQVLGHDITLAQQFTVLITALLVSIGAAGIPHAGLVMMVIIFEAIGLPIEATALIWAVDRIVDMGRTATNVWSDSVGALIINHSEKKNS